MADHSTPNLPSRDFDATERFYRSLGFEPSWKDGGWMILRKGALILEFFPFPDLDPAENSFGCCLRLDDVDAFHKLCVDAGVPAARQGIPRLVPPRAEHWGGKVGIWLTRTGRCCASSRTAEKASSEASTRRPATAWRSTCRLRP